MPHAVLLGDFASLVNQNLERQANLFDVAPYRVSALRDDCDQADAAASINVDMSCQFTELAAAVRSPCASMESEQNRSALKKLRHRAQLALLVAELEQRGLAKWRLTGHGHQNSFTSTISPASTISVWAGISM
jgi:hypothetical protein